MAQVKEKEYRYVKGKSKELKRNTHMREMIEMIKSEEVKDNLYVKAVKLSIHAFKRFKDIYPDVNNLATANKIVKDMLKSATRIGSVLSYDGRINVLYAFDKHAIFLSPDLKTVVTINQYKDISYQPIIRKLGISGVKNFSREDLIEVHQEHIRNIEIAESKQVEKMLVIERNVREAREMYEGLLAIYKKKKTANAKAKSQLKSLIAQRNLELKMEGWKLFDIKVKKRHICKSLVSLY